MIKISFTSSNKTILAVYEKYLLHLLKQYKISTNDYIFATLPVKIKTITLLNSPHVQKKSKSSYEIRSFKKSLILVNNYDSNLISKIITVAPLLIKVTVTINSTLVKN